MTIAKPAHVRCSIPTELESTTTEPHDLLFRDGCHQAERILHEFELEGAGVLNRKAGDNLILTRIRTNRLLDLQASWEPLAKGLPEVEDLPTQ